MMVISTRLKWLLKDFGIEEQNGFMGRRGGSDGSLCTPRTLGKRQGHGKGSRVLLVNLVKAFGTVPRDVLFVVLAKFGVPPHLTSDIKFMKTDLQVTFDLNDEPVVVPCTGGAKHVRPLHPAALAAVSCWVVLVRVRASVSAQPGPRPLGHSYLPRAA